MNYLLRLTLWTLLLTLLPTAPILATPGGQSPADDDEEPAAASGQDRDEEDDQVRIEWRDGPRIGTADGRFLFRIGGRLNLDSAFFSDEAPFEGRGGRVEDAVEIRRLRVDFRGHVYDRVEYRAQVDFAGGDAAAKDVYVGVRGLPTTLRFGHMKEPFSLEEVTSSNYIQFAERSLMNVLAPARNVGAYADGSLADDRVQWAAGVFRDTNDFGDGAGTANFTGRVTATPVWLDEGRRFLHLGAGFTHKELDGSLRLRARPEVHLAPRVIDVTIPADSADYLGLEAGGNLGPLTMSAEYTRASFDGPAEPTVDAYYISGGWFVTGESRPYGGMSWGRVRPRRNFLEAGGPGAVMLGARYSRIDLAEASADPASEMSALTLGVNWHWNPSTRVMLNWVRTELETLGDSAMLTLRLQVHL